MRRMPRRTAMPLGVTAVTIALALSACGSGSTDGAGGGSNGGAAGAAGGDKGTLTLAMTLDDYGWDPSNQPGYQNWKAEAVWDSLVKCNAVGELEPDVSDEWEVTRNNTTFEAHIREGMKFSDGTPVDADAVKASFEFVTENGGSAADYEGIKIKVSDPQNIAITWPEPQPVMSNKVCAPRIAPAAYLKAGKFDKPLGSGPYVLDEAGTTTGSVYAFTKNPDHWNADHYPYDKLALKVFKDETAAVSALKTDQIDASLVPQSAVAEAEGSGLDVLGFKGQTTRLIISDRKGEVEPALGDVRVRQAMNMVFDKEEMAASLYQGNAEPTAQVFREGTAAWIDGLEDPYPFDVEKAKSLMAEAGYSDGFDLELPTMEGQNFENLMPYVTQQLAEINIDVKQVPLSGANAITELLSGKFPVVLWQLGNLGNSALQIYIEDTVPGWWELQDQPNEFIDSRWEQIATADPAESERLQKEINQYLVDEAWFAPMVYMGTNYAYNADKVSIPTQSDQEALTPKLRDFQ
jgi:peptide/nickel transport system substrate-binding protein